MSLISIIVALIVVGVLLWVVETLIPMDARVRRVLEVVIVVALLIYVLQGFGVLSGHSVSVR